MYKIALNILFVIGCAATALAQPGTEIYLFDLKTKGDQVSLSSGRNITNRKGYDNQPFFHPEKPLLYFVSADTAGRTDIFEYNYKANKSRRVTQTHDKEYSPTVTPDKKFISCILQTDSGAQNLVKYPIDGGSPRMIIENLIVGYHAWMNDDNVVTFVLPRPFQLHKLNVSSGKDVVVTDSIGRSLHRIPGTKDVSFIQVVSATESEIRKLDLQGNVTTITKSLFSVEKDMTWAPDGKILMSDETKIFYIDPGKVEVWKEVKIDSAVPLNKITRLAVNPKNNTVALVVSE